MKPLLVYLFLSGLLTSFACHHKQVPQQTNTNGTINNNNGNTVNNNPAAKDTTPITSWQVKGCAEKVAKGDTKFPSSGEYNDYPDLPMPGDNGITAEGDSIIYSRFVNHGCCRKVEISTKQHEKVITIIEYWTGQICKCMCSSIVRAVVKKLPKGKYQVYAIETGTDPIDDKPHEGRDTVMQQIVTIK